MQLLKSAKIELLRSNADHRHPFRLFSLATINEYPEIRTVVKRKTESNLETIFFTDSRSPKIRDIRNFPNVSALFYHPTQKLQLRIKGTAQLIDADHAEYPYFFEQIKNARNIHDYTSAQAPGSVIDSFAALKYVEDIFFIAVRIIPLYIDVLQLHTEQHKRAIYRKEQNAWIETLITP